MESSKIELPVRDPGGAAVAVAAQGILMVGAWVATLLCGGMPQGSLGVFLLVAGLVLIFLPPRQCVGWIFWAAGALVVGGAALALLPAGWVPMAGWRLGFASSGLFSGLTRISVVPEETAFWVGVLGCSILAGLYSLSQPVRALALLWFSAGAALLCGVMSGLAMYSLQAHWVPPFHGGSDFGFLPNHNHTATWLVTGCLTGIAAVSGGIISRRFVVAFVGALGLAVCAWPLLLVSSSRGGVIFLLLGVGLWIAGLGRRVLSKRMAVSAAVLFGVALVFLLGTQNPVKERIEGSGLGETGRSLAETDARILIYEDTLRMIHDFPLTGAGIGAYKFIYPQYAEASLTDSDAIHPESDWLMLIAESGPLALAGVLCAFVFLFAGLKGAKAHPLWPARWGMICAALAGVLHGLVDVPFHRVELGWWILLIGTMGFARISPVPHPASRRAQHILYIVAGICMVVFGVNLIRAQWFEGAALAPFAPDLARKEIIERYQKGDLEATLDFAREQSKRWPVSYPLRYQHGCLAMGFVELDGEADAEFAAARMLQPRWWRIPLDEGTRWIEYDDPGRATGLWWEAISRRSTESERLATYVDVLGLARQKPVPLALMMPPQASSPAFHFAWLETSPEAAARISQLAGESSFVEGLDETDRSHFLSLWFTRGDKVALWTFLGNHPEWESAAWSVRVRDMAARGDDEGAARALATRFGISLELPDTRSPAGTLDAEIAQLLADGNQVAIRRILSESAAAKPLEDATQARRIQAALAARAGDWKTAYAKLVELLRATNQVSGGSL